MKLELQITARNLELSDAFKEEIRQKAEKLNKFYDRIMRCRVVAEIPHRYHHEVIQYNVHIYLTVPGTELIIKREQNKDLNAAIRDAFDAARRRLEDFAGQRRGTVKQHEAALHARVAQLYPDKGYGFLMTPDNREIYFHENSVLNHEFKHLRAGTKVRFVEEQGTKGPQASTVKVVRRRS